MLRFRFTATFLLIVSATLMVAAQSPQPFHITTDSLPTPVVSAYYSVQLRAAGGVPPYQWSLAAGTLPPTLKLDPSGLLVGTPSKPGPVLLTLRVTDSSSPPQSATQEYRGEIKPAIAVIWKRPPRLENGGIFGAVVLENNLSRSMDLTLIIVAVNEIGKAFVLGYQHPLMQPQTITPEIQFGATLPRGSYVVHVDAVAENPETEALFRSRLQTPAVLQVP